MGGVFGKEKPLKEQLRENKRMITRAIRELDREKRSLEKEEQRLTIEIKKMAKENQMKGVFIYFYTDLLCRLCTITESLIILLIFSYSCQNHGKGLGTDTTVYYQIY